MSRSLHNHKGLLSVFQWGLCAFSLALHSVGHRLLGCIRSLLYSA